MFSSSILGSFLELLKITLIVLIGHMRKPRFQSREGLGAEKGEIFGVLTSHHHPCRYLDQPQLSKADQDSFPPPGTHEALLRTALSPPPPPTRPVSPPQRAEEASSTQAQVRSHHSSLSLGTRHKCRENLLVVQKIQSP